MSAFIYHTNSLTNKNISQRSNLITFCQQKIYRLFYLQNLNIKSETKLDEIFISLISVLKNT